MKLLTTLTGTELKGARCLVTGGCGFLGCYLVKMILEAGAELVVVLDVRKSPLFSQFVGDNSKLKLVLGNILDKQQVLNAVKGVDIVFHTAAYFGFPVFSSNSFGDYDKVMDVNVNGTSNVLQACKENGVKSLIYTSSVHVMFDGFTPIVNGDEKLPYPLRHPDPYGVAKATAEREVISTNGKHNIATCSLRPNGLYGPGEFNCVGRGLLKFRSWGGAFFSIGPLDDTKAVSDWTYVENFAHSNILAAVLLLKDGTKSKIAGQCYNITDGILYNNIEFFKDFLLKAGMKWNICFNIPPGLMLPIARVAEMACHVLGPIYPMQPFLTPVEIQKLVTTHYFSSEKAKADLGYQPLPSAKCREITVDYFVNWLKEQEHKTDHYFSSLRSIALVILLIALLFQFILWKWIS